ncbi:MAG: tyrosine-type recombinase/integrase [Thermaerobacter sp.]|nr:tyrosine-type recombinase/integrase [Thermaerobacter sp.]
MDAQEFVDRLARERKPATAQAAADALRAWSQDHGQDWRLRTPPREAVTAPQSLDRQAQYKLRRAAMASSPRDAALVALLLLAGLRVSEVLALSPADVVIRERSGQVVVRHGKGNKRRTVPLNATAREMLAPWLAERTGEAMLFPGGRGRERLTRQETWEVLHRLSGRARVEGMHPHALRHSFGKGLVDAGGSLDPVALLLDHSSLDTTASYTRPTEQDLEAAVDLMGWGVCAARKSTRSSCRQKVVRF